MALLHDESAGVRDTRKPLLRNTLMNLAGLMAVTLAAAILLRFEMALGWDFVVATILSLSIIFSFVIYLLPAHPHRRFGYANIVTAFRASLVSLTGATVLCFEGLQQADTVLWVLVGVVLLVLALDGIDGYLARRYHQVSQLGARFDMEVDAFLILILSIAAAVLDKAGSWVLLIGLMRYGFVAASWAIPALKAELPPSIRRKAICVVQVSALCFILVPWVTGSVSQIFAGASLALLAGSFAIDVFYLLRKPVRA